MSNLARILKSNPNHDAAGLFSKASGASSVSGLHAFHGSPAADVIRREGFKSTMPKNGQAYGDGLYATTRRSFAEGYGEVLAVKVKGPLKVLTDSQFEKMFAGEAVLARGDAIRAATGQLPSAAFKQAQRESLDTLRGKYVGYIVRPDTYKKGDLDIVVVFNPKNLVVAPEKGATTFTAVKKATAKKEDLALVLKRNPFHDATGAFAKANSATFVSTGDKFAAGHARRAAAGGTKEDVDWSVVPKGNAELAKAAEDGSTFGDRKSPYDWVENNEAAMVKAAASLDMPVAKFKAELQKELESEMKDANLFINMPEAAFSKVMKEGEFKNQYQTNASKGYFSPGMRQRFEEHFFGVEGREGYGKGMDEGTITTKTKTRGGRKMDVEDGHLTAAQAAARPIYGYLQKGDATHPGTASYGDVRVKLKNEAKARATFTGDDSLNVMSQSENNPAQSYATRFDKQDHSKVHPTYQNLAKMIPSPVNKPSIRSLHPSTYGLQPKSVKEHASLKPTHTYREAQMWGGVKIKDIDYVIFRTTPSKSLQQYMAKNKIKYRTREEG